MRALAVALVPFATALALALTAPVLAPALAKDIAVGPSADDRTLARAVRASSFGDTLRLRPGTYEASDLAIPHDLTIEGETGPGGAGVTITASGPVAKGLLVPGGGVNLTVRNVTFADARSPDRNGAGIRHEGADLTVENVTFRGNENGILATGAPTGRLTIRRSLFESNGSGDGYSHGVYQSRGSRIDVSESRFVGTRIGHHVKSLAPLVVVKGNTFDDADGRPSYVVDATGGGRLIVTYNEVIRRADAEQDTLVNYDTSRGGTLGDVVIEGNALVTQKPGVRVLRNPEGAPAVVQNNRLEARGRGSFRGTARVSAPTVRDDASAAGDAPGGIDPAALGRLAPKQRRAVERMLRAQETAATSAAPAPPARSSDGLLHAPRLRTPEGALTAFRLLPSPNGNPRAASGEVVTFGQVFAPGLLTPGTPVRAVLDGAPVPTQLDVKATHADGSVRHGVLSVLAPPADGQDGRVRDGVLMVGAAPSARAPAAPPALTVALRGEGPGGAFVRTIRLGEGRLGEGWAPLWLAGPLVRERSEVHQVTPLLRLRAETRTDGAGGARVRLTIENHETYAPGARDHAYEVTVRNEEGEAVWASGPVRHYRHAGWTAVLPGGEPSYAVQHDPRALIASGAFPPLDLSVPVAADAIVPTPARSPRPGERALLTAYMPTSGGREEIGIVTGWTARWLKTQDPRARAAMLRAAAEGLTLPWHFEDGGRLLTGAARPRFWADPRGAGETFDAFPEEAWSDAPGGWTVDLPHKPSLAFPAYMATGEAVFARALAHEAAFAVTGVWPDLRGPSGQIVTRQLETRGAAWSLRTIADAAWGLPDEDPAKSVFAETLSRNIRALEAQVTAGGDLRGALLQDGDEVAPWQQDFLVMVLAQEARRGTPNAAAALRAMTPWLRTRMAGGVAYASAARIVVREGGALTSAARSLALTDAPEVNRDGADGYLGVLIAALSAAYDATGDEALLSAAREAGRQGARLRDPANRVGLVHEPQMGWATP